MNSCLQIVSLNALQGYLSDVLGERSGCETSVCMWGPWCPGDGQSSGGGTGVWGLCTPAGPPVLCPTCAVLTLLCSVPRTFCFSGFPPQLTWPWWMERRAVCTLLGILLGSSQEKLKLTWMKNWTSGLGREYRVPDADLCLRSSLCWDLPWNSLSSRRVH